MYLKSLTLRGFKSFASATTLHFEPGITCVVGPNGSGKSNVVDALSWVMGEQGAKTLRGGKMEDVIFAGTAGRPPLGRAEVVLTIDNRDGALPVDYPEVTLSRTMFRNGGSDYSINGRPARLLDVQELLSDSGIGRELHVIVGQGQLDSILQATPEVRRGFVEEAAGVLKHRKRKEKALRKLEATEANLARLSDLLTEIRRQLKPLGHQAEVARRAAVVQAEVRDARARLLADELVAARDALASDLADEAVLRERRARVEQALAEARSAEAAAESALAACAPRLSAAQEVRYALVALRERVATTASVAAERVRNGVQTGEDRFGRDPDELDAEAAEAEASEAELSAEVRARAAALAACTAAREDAERALATEEVRLAGQLRTAADRREGLARLHGQVAALRSRVEGADAELGRLAATSRLAEQREAEARAAFTALESRIAGLDAGELDLDAEHEHAEAELAALDLELADLRAAAQAATSERAAAVARLEALQLGLRRQDARAAVLAAADRLDVLGPLAALLTVEPGWETAVSAALGTAADAVAVRGSDAALGAVGELKDTDRGRAALLVASPAGDVSAVAGTDGIRWAVELVTCPAELRTPVTVLLRSVAVVEDLGAAHALVEARPGLTAVTRGGDVYSRHLVVGGSAATPSLIEVQAAVEECERRLAEGAHAAERLRFAQTELDRRRADVQRTVEVALARLHQSDAAMSAVAEQLGQLAASAASAAEEAERIRGAAAEAERTREVNLLALADLEQRAAAATEPDAMAEPDPSRRDGLAERAREARAAEMDARLALRTGEERARALAGRAAALRAGARQVRVARADARERRERLLREADVARAVTAAAGYLSARVESSLRLADTERDAAETARIRAEAELAVARRSGRELAASLQDLVDSVHRDELARAEQRVRTDGLEDKAQTELGLAADVLVAEYGPDQPVPVLTAADGSALAADEWREPVPYVRDEQQHRLRRAERALAVLGRVNPLALEEFAALEERHAFLSEQLDDLRRTRKDLLDLVAEVDARVEQVFADAYADVAAAFERVFARLFPGGEGRLVLTEPGSWLTTGVDVEARPAGKKVKRLSLLSGGERSLVAVAFLVALFLARPSPFYVLDEVEAALDDTNLGRLLEIYTELRDSSQLLVITHQKRTMEVADALYGVTMRGDGVSAVISQRLREVESVA